MELFQKGSGPEKLVTDGEADQMIAMVLAERAVAQTHRPISEVAETLGVSEEKALEMLNVIRAQQKNPDRKLRSTPGLEREKLVLRWALIASIAIVGFILSVGLRMYFSNSYPNTIQTDDGRRQVAQAPRDMRGHPMMDTGRYVWNGNTYVWDPWFEARAFPGDQNGAKP